MIIALDESGTDSNDFMVIGALFVPSPGGLHNRLIQIKEEEKYYNSGSKHGAKYKEVHFKKISSPRDERVAKKWIDAFLEYPCWYRSVVIEWEVWNPKYFGGPFDTDALKKRRAYKKWAEMLLQPELKSQSHAWLKLDELKVLYRYDIVKELEERFGRPYMGRPPRISRFQKVASWNDAHQDVQLSDLLTGCVHNCLVPPEGERGRKKIAVRNYLFEQLRDKFNVGGHTLGYWKGQAKTTLIQRFPRFSMWVWRPGE